MSVIVKDQRPATANSLVLETVISISNVGDIQGALYFVETKEDNSDILTSRVVKQRVLDILDEPPTR